MAQTHKTIDRRKAKTDEQSVAKRLAAAQGQKKNAPAAPVGTAAQNTNRGSYYSPRQYGADAGQYEARVTQTRAAMEERAPALREQQRAMEAARAEAEAKRDRWETIQGKLRGENAAELYAKADAERSEAVGRYRECLTAYQDAYQKYLPYETAHNDAVNAYNDYMTAEREEQARWKSTIRDAESIRAEQKTLAGSRAELKRLMMQSNDIAEGRAAPGVQAQAAQIEERIAELQAYLGGVGEREKLLSEELEWSEHFLYEDLRQNADFAAGSAYRPRSDSLYNQVNAGTGAYQQDLFRSDAFAGIYGHMGGDEVEMYNYLYSAQGPEAAKGYLQYLEPELNRRRTEKATGQVGEWATKSPLNAALASVGSLVVSPISGIEATIGQFAAKLRGEEIYPNDSSAMFSNVKNAVREAVSAKIEEHAGPVGSFAYGTVMSMGDMLMDAASGNPTVAMAMIGSRAFSEQVIDAKNRGLSDGEALALGVASAAAELVTEKLGLDELLKLPDGWEDAGFWKGLAKGAWGEAKEEGLTNLMNLAADLGVAGDRSEFIQSLERYKKEGMSEFDASLTALKDAGISLGADMLGGALSGGAFGGYRGAKGKRAADIAAKNEKAAESAAGTVSEMETIEDAAEKASGASNQTSNQTSDTAGVVGSETEKTAPVAGVSGDSPAVGANNAQTGQETLVENGGMTDEAAGERVLHGGIERADRAGAGEQVEPYEQRRERQRREAQSASQTAAQRRVKAENLEKLGKAQRVSLQDMGIRQGAEARTVLELPKYEWDEDLYNTVSRLEKETGYKVRCVTGNFAVKAKGGGTKLVRGCIDRVTEQIVLNVAHSTVTADQIADHELYHWKMEATGRLGGDRYRVTRECVKRIKEEYDEETFDEVLDAYFEGYGEVYDTDNVEEFLNRVYEEIMADAYAGINAFGVEAGKFRSTVDHVMDENGMGRNVWNAAEQEDVTAPGGDQQVYTDEDAPPEKEYEDYSQVPEAEYGPEGDWQIPFSYGGETDDDGKFNVQEISAIQNIGRVSVNQFNDAAIRATNKLARRYWREMGVKSPFFRAWFGDWRAKDRTVVQQANVPGTTKNQPVTNLDTGWKINISGKVFDENKVHKTLANRTATPYMQYLDDIIKKAILLDSSGCEPKSPNTLLMHSLYVVADVGSGPEVLRLYVEEMNSPAGAATGKRAYNLQNIEKAFATRKRVQGGTPSSSANATNAIRTVADLFDAVKVYDDHFSPNPPSKIVNPDGTPKVMYHGTNAEWNSYDLSKNTNQMWGEGIYLAETPERAKLYGDNVRALYVSAQYNNRDAKRLGVKRDHTVMKSGDVLVYSPEQIKSAQGNTGTFNSYDDDIRFSVEDEADSQGNRLSQEQREFFKDSKVRDERGRLMVMYHGTPNGSHTTFRPGTYFTPNREYADKYQNPNASMLSTKRNADRPKTYEVYLNIRKPFDTRNPKERGIFMQEYYRQWGTGAPLADSGLPDWTDGMDLQEFIEEMGYDYDGLILDEGATGGYGLEVKSRGLSYVTFSSEQVKNVDNRNPTEDPDIRFSVDDDDGVPEDRGGYHFPAAAPASAFWLDDDDGVPEDRGGYHFPAAAPASDFSLLDDDDYLDGRFLLDDDDDIYPDIRFSVEDDELTREAYDKLMAEVAGDQGKRNDAFIREKLTPEQYKQFKAFQRDDRMDAEAEARVRGIERFEEAMEREELEVLRAQQAEDAAAGRRELKAEEKAAAEQAAQLRQTARQERKDKARREREKAQQEAKDRIRRAGDTAPTGSAPTIAKKELQDRLIGLFSVGEGQRSELRKMIGELADRMIAEGNLDDRDLRRLIDRLYDSGVMVIEPEEVFKEGRSYIKDEHIYISPELIRELGDDWETLRKRAWGLGVYLSTDRKYAGLDVWNRDMASYLPGMFNAEETDQRTMLERLLWIAEEGKAERISLVEYTKRIAKAEHQSEEALLANMERQVEEALRTFAEKARLETRLKDRAARQRAMDKEEQAIARETERAERKRLREDLADERAYHREQNAAERQQIEKQRAEMELQNARERRKLAEERAARRQKAQETKRKKELRELQQKTLNALNWIAKNRRKAPEAMKEAMGEVLGNIDLYAISMADEMNWSSKHQATWKDLKQLYLHAQAEDPNFLPSDDLQRIVDRLDKTQLEELDLDQLRDLYQAAVGLRTEFYNRNNVIGDAEWEMMEELYSGCVEEMRTAPKKLKGMLDRFLNLEQLTPMNVFEEMGGFNPDGMLYRFAKQLEAGEKAMRSFKVRSNKLLADFLTENEEWVRKADGQGKDGEWIKCEIPELIAMKVGETPQFGGTVTVWMTPLQRVHLYLESRNYDNLRHMTGGRTFPDKALYSEGKREEAFAQGTTIRMAPETVQMLVKDMSQEEMELAKLLDRYYNDLAKTEINKVSNVLLGYDKAMGGKYAPIFTNGNYTKSEFGKYDGTAEGAGNLKERVKSKLPSYNISALEAFERNMDRTATYVGMAIPARNWNTLMNWRTSNSSFADEITHTWGKGRLDYIQDLITDLQNPMGEQQDMVSEMAGKLQSNYISATFGFNPGIVVKQLGSIPMASAYLGWSHFPKGIIGKGKIDRELIGKYTQELDWRTMGYSMPETKQLKDAPNWSQKNKTVGLIFGGDAITAMDGWAASVLWPWAENKVRADFPDLEVGDAATVEAGLSPFYKKVAEVFDDAVSRSQSVSDQMHQGRLRKSKNPAAKTFTMFRSDSAQSYNVLRQRLGEMDYYRRQGKNFADRADAMKAAAGAAATAILVNSLWGTAVDLLVKALKGKLDEEDKEPLEIVEDFFWGVIDSWAGLATGGDILAELVGGWFTGEQRYDTEAPGIEQFNDIMDAADKVINAGKKGNVLGAIKTAAETIAVYGGGIPVKNVEAYLKGILSVVLPGVVVGYEDLLKAPAKADLKGLEGDGLMVRLNNVLKGYGMKLDRESREAIAKLYEQGYTEAVPSAAPNSVTIEGVELELDERMRKAYDKTRGGIIERELAQIVGSAFFAEADAKTQKSMLTKLYNYAAEKAKGSVLEGYEISASAMAIDEIIASGGSAADYAVFDAATANMAAWQKALVLREWDTDEAVTGLMFKHLVSKSWEEELAELGKVGVDMGQFLELYAKHGEIDAQDLSASTKATNFAYWLDGQRYGDEQKAVVKDQMAFFQFMPAEASRYNTATAAGLDREQALDLTRDLDALEPPEGKTSVQDIQKYRVAVDNSVSESNQLKMLAAAGLKGSTYDKVAKGYEMGVAPAAWVRVNEVKLEFDANGNGSMTQAEWAKAIEGICAYGIVLPGDNTRFNLTNDQKAILWQTLVDKDTKATNNPFDPEAGRRWRQAMGYE